MEGLVSQVSAHHGDQYHEVPVLLCPLLQTVNAVGVPEIMDSGAVPGMGNAGLPEKAPEVFIDIPQRHRLSTEAREKISFRLWKRMDLSGILAQPQCHGFRHGDQTAVMVL